MYKNKTKVHTSTLHLRIQDLVFARRRRCEWQSIESALSNTHTRVHRQENPWILDASKRVRARAFPESLVIHSPLFSPPPVHHYDHDRSPLEVWSCETFKWICILGIACDDDDDDFLVFLLPALSLSCSCCKSSLRLSQNEEEKRPLFPKRERNFPVCFLIEMY